MVTPAGWGDAGQEDWLRGRVWDVTNPDGSLVESLPALARVLGCSVPVAAARLLAEPFGVPAPAGLRADAAAAAAV